MHASVEVKGGQWCYSRASGAFTVYKQVGDVSIRTNCVHTIVYYSLSPVYVYAVACCVHDGMKCKIYKQISYLVYITKDL